MNQVPNIETVLERRLLDQPILFHSFLLGCIHIGQGITAGGVGDDFKCVSP